jgi:SWI/SNF-related matrix-associated actin-dependent regulator of chromatin subfamily A-like protein 1
MDLYFTGRRYICACSFDERFRPKRAGFRWDTVTKKWFTEDTRIAARLREYADVTAERQLSSVLINVSPWTGGLPTPKGLVLRDFQKEAALFALARNRAYLGLDPGLGKTVIAAIMANARAVPVLYICPPHLALNVKEEFSKWNTTRVPLWVLRDTRLDRDDTQRIIEKSYGKVSMVFIDEAHRFKNDSAKRSKALFKRILPHFYWQYFLSGTPMPNRPMELYTVLNHAAPETIDFMNQFEYGRKYCAGHKNDFGWDFSGASNVPELAEKVKSTFMLRMRKDDVLKELPPKTEEMILLGDNLPSKLIAMDRKILRAHSPEDLMRGLFGGEDLHIATYRRELGAYKLKLACAYLTGLLKDSDEHILVFAYHREVIAGLTKALAGFNPLVVTGDTPMTQRHEYVKAFQASGSTHRCFIGNIQAAGTGFTLTRATRVVFVEFSWVPADNDQASDRAHRIGQRDNVFVQYLVFRNSVDRTVLDAIFAKRKVIAHV